MEKAVVRRGIGAVVLALVAALLLGYLLKGKRDARQDVVKMELPKTPIQIFPEGQSETSAEQNTAATTAGANTAGASIVSSGKEGAKKAAQVVADTGKKATQAAADTGKKVAKAGANLVVDKETGNPHLDKSKVVIDGAGQAVYGTKKSGPKDTPANFAFRTPSSKEVRPAVDGKYTLNKDSASKTKKVVAKSNAKLVHEKKLPPVGKSTGKSGKPVKIASSRNTSGKKLTSRSTAKKTTPKKASTSVAAGRNKYAVQLLATSSSAKANSIKNTFKREGYAVYVTKEKRGGRMLYRVRVGSYTGRSSALKQQAAMKRRYQKNPYVQSSIVTK